VHVAVIALAGGRAAHWSAGLAEVAGREITVQIGLNTARRPNRHAADGEREEVAGGRSRPGTSAPASSGALTPLAGVSRRAVGTWNPGTVVALQGAVGNRHTTELLAASRRRSLAPTAQRQHHGSPAPPSTTPATAGPDAVPPVGEMAQTSMTWIEQVWGALNQGLSDFEQNNQVTDWEAFALGVLGNLIWAAAAFATGGSAFLVSVAGVGLASAAAANVRSQESFHTAARAEHDALNNALKARVPAVTQRVHEHAVSHGWTASQAYRVLMRLLLRREFIQVVGGVPTVNSPRIAAHVEQQLILKSGSTPSETWAGWRHGDWWLQYEYRVDGAMEPGQRVNPFSQWRLSRDKEDAQLLPIDTDVRHARDRLNALRATLGTQHHPSSWPLNKQLQVYFLGSRAVTVNLDGNNRIVGTGGMYLDREELGRIGEAAGWSDLGQGIVSWVWAGSNGLPPPISTIR
jgi:hypothetical protein